MVYHLVTTSYWDSLVEKYPYHSADFDKEKFIHLSTATQVVGVLDRYYQAESDIVLLVLDDTKMNDYLKYEKSSFGELFPHLYGPIEEKYVLKIVRADKSTIKSTFL